MLLSVSLFFFFPLSASNDLIKKGVVTPSLALCFASSKSTLSPCTPAHTDAGEGKP